MPKVVVLVVLWCFLISLCFSTFIAQIHTSSLRHLAPLVALSVTAVLSPIAGLLASMCFTRYKVIRTGYWMMWFGIDFTVAILVCEGIFPDYKQVWNYIMTLGEAVYSAGFAITGVNLLPFGLDQIPTASAEEIKAFIDWYAWALGAGTATSMFAGAITECTQLSELDSVRIVLIFSATLLSLLLCSSYIHKEWLIIEPSGGNPLKNMCGIVRFALKHGRPIRRSAFTYCEDKKPPRIDYAKAKYGGPFTTEQVEDVKTCLRIVVVLISSLVIIVPAAVLVLSFPHFLDAQFTEPDQSSCHHELIRISYMAPPLLVVSPPMCKVFKYILFGRRDVGILKGICITQLLPIFISVTLLTLSTIWYFTHTSSNCMFASDQTSPFPVERHWIEVPATFINITYIYFTSVGFLKFIFAQSPYTQKGLLFGLVYLVFISGYGLCVLMYQEFRLQYAREGQNNPSCGIWFYLFITAATITGSALWGCLTKWYKTRERDEPDRGREFVEEYYERYCRGRD